MWINSRTTALGRAGKKPAVSLAEGGVVGRRPDSDLLFWPELGEASARSGYTRITVDRGATRQRGTAQRDDEFGAGAFRDTVTPGPIHRSRHDCCRVLCARPGPVLDTGAAHLPPSRRQYRRRFGDGCRL